MPHSVAKKSNPLPARPPKIPKYGFAPVIFHSSLSQEEHVDSQETAELQ